MRDINLFTNSQVTQEICYNLLKDKIKNVVKNGDELLVNTKLKVFIDFDQYRMLEYPIPFEQDFINRIPLNNPYMMGLGYHKSNDVKNIIKVLYEAYPELYVNVDDETDWVGSASEYLEKEFDY